MRLIKWAVSTRPSALFLDPTALPRIPTPIVGFPSFGSSTTRDLRKGFEFANARKSLACTRRAHYSKDPCEPVSNGRGSDSRERGSTFLSRNNRPLAKILRLTFPRSRRALRPGSLSLFSLLLRSSDGAPKLRRRNGAKNVRQFSRRNITKRARRVRVRRIRNTCLLERTRGRNESGKLHSQIFESGIIVCECQRVLKATEHRENPATITVFETKAHCCRRTAALRRSKTRNVYVRVSSRNTGESNAYRVPFRFVHGTRAVWIYARDLG